MKDEAHRTVILHPSAFILPECLAALPGSTARQLPNRRKSAILSGSL
jgi:hypothetical protein